MKDFLKNFIPFLAISTGAQIASGVAVSAYSDGNYFKAGFALGSAAVALLVLHHLLREAA